MAHKQVLFRSAAREKILRGATQLADAIRVTLGPRSKAVLIERKWGAPIVCNDGVTIAKEFDLKDAEENLGTQVLRQAAEKTGDVVGDGTSTSTILAHAILADGVRNVVAGANAVTNLVLARGWKTKGTLPHRQIPDRLIWLKPGNLACAHKVSSLEFSEAYDGRTPNSIDFTRKSLLHRR